MFDRDATMSDVSIEDHSLLLICQHQSSLPAARIDRDSDGCGFVLDHSVQDDDERELPQSRGSARSQQPACHGRVGRVQRSAICVHDEHFVQLIILRGVGEISPLDCSVGGVAIHEWIAVCLDDV